MFLALTIIIGVSLLVVSGQIKLYTQPEPRPVTPPPEILRATNPMIQLGRSQNYSASRVSSYQRQGGPRDNFWIPTDGEEVTLADIQGPGAISHIWMTHRGGGRDLILRMYWDQNDHPSVEAPIGDFFGVAMGINAPINSWPVHFSSEGRYRNCWWYMPFNKSVRITVSATRSAENLERDTVPLYFYIDYQVYGQPINDINYFHARFYETDPAQRGKPVKLLEVQGQGHFVGVVMGNQVRTPGWFGEGDDIITVDGQVSFLGTGTEDYFCDAWGFRVFSDLYHGVAALEGREVGDRLSVYRFHIMDPIPFIKSFKFEIEHWPWISPWPNTGRDYFSSVGFWYQKNIHQPWPRLGKIISHETWDPHKGRWFVPDALETEDLEIISFESTRGPDVRPAIQHLMPNLSGDHLLFFDAGDRGWVSLNVPAPETGLYSVKIFYVRAVDYGKVQLSVNGHSQGDPVDTYLETDDLTRPVWPPKEFVFPGIPLNQGKNIFQFSIDSKNSESQGFIIGIDCLVLEMQNK